MNVDFARCIPILPSQDITGTRDFYVGKLGFAATWGDDSDLIVKRDDMDIHFYKAGDQRYADHPSCYIRGGEVPALYEEYAGAASPASRPSRCGPGT
jgi:hypothetical protein